MRIHFSALITTALVSASLITTVPAAPIAMNLPGTTSYDGWENMTSGNYPGYPGFGSSAAWPSPIGSNTTNSGDAVVNKVSGTANPAGASLYSGVYANTPPNTFGSTLVVSDTTVPLNLKNVVFQIDIGAASGYDFYNGVLPTLSYNDGGQNITATYSTILSQVQDGTFTNPDTGLDEPVYITLYGLQWDLSSVSTPINSIQISWSTVQHSQVYSLRLDQSDTFVQAIPEPSTWFLLSLSITALVAFRLHRRVAANR